MHLEKGGGTGRRAEQGVLRRHGGVVRGEREAVEAAHAMRQTPFSLLPAGAAPHCALHFHSPAQPRFSFLQAMGGSQGRQMASGPCGHVYCHECLVEAVRAQVGRQPGRQAEELVAGSHAYLPPVLLPPVSAGCISLTTYTTSPPDHPPLVVPLTAPPSRAWWPPPLPQKKCPTCRKNMQARQIHKVFVNFS